MRFFLDNCIPIRLARILELAEYDVYHLQDEWPDADYPGGVDDEVWIPEVAKRANVVISADLKMSTRQAQILALKKAGLITYLVYSGFSEHGINMQVQWLFKNWWRIDDHLPSASKGQVFAIRSDGKMIEMHVRR